MGDHKAPGDKAPQAPGPVPSIQDLSGVWVLEKHLSSNIPLILKLQKIPWLVRKVIDSATIHLHATQYTSTDPKTNEPRIHLDLVQRSSVNIGIGDIEDNRILDWEERPHEDYVFGSVVTRSRYVTGVGFGEDEDGKGARPDIHLSLDVGGEDGERVLRFLKGEIDADGGDCDGFLVEPWPGCDSENAEGKGLWVQTLERSEKSAWTAETIWGFEMMNGERCLTTRVAAVDGKGDYQLGKCVFQLLSREC